MSPRPTHRAHETPVLHAVMGGVASVLVVQWVLLSVAIEGYLSSRQPLLNWSTLGSGLCLAMAVWLVRHLRLGDRS